MNSIFQGILYKYPFLSVDGIQLYLPCFPSSRSTNQNDIGFIHKPLVEPVTERDGVLIRWLSVIIVVQVKTDRFLRWQIENWLHCHLGHAQLYQQHSVL